MKKNHVLLFTLVSVFALNAQTTANFSTAEGYTNGLLSNNTNWGGQFFYVNTTNESVATQSNTAEAFWGQSQPISEGETITFEVDMSFGGDLGYTANTFVAQIGFNAGGTTSSGGSDRQFIYLKALTNGKLKMEKRAGGNLASTPGYVEGWDIDTWKNEDLTVKVSFLLGNSASTSTVTARLINRTTGEFTDAAFDQNGIFSTTVYNGAVNGNLYGFFRTLTLQDGDGATTESFSVSSVKLINEDTLFPSIFTNTTSDNQWATAANWDSGSVPSSYTDVTISSGQAIEAGNTTAAVANTIIVDSGGSLTIDETSSLTVSDDFTNNGTVTLNSDSDEFASIIVQGSSSGDIVYNRYVNTVGTAEWDLIGAPTDGLSISSFVTTNSTPLATSGSIYAVGEYDNSNNSWTNYTSSTVGAAGNFDIGRGYQMATSSGATMAFTGTVATTDQTQSIINNAGNGGRRWNLVANPYPSYLNANINAHNSNNFLSVNSGVIDSNYSAIYGYDADGSGYTIYNNTNAATYIAPGQAFFVAAASSSAANLSFTEAMQTTTGGDDFIAGRMANTSSELYLKLYEGQDLVGDTKFYFDNNLSLGLDPGYDAGAYNQSSALSSRLAEDDQGVNMGINAMGIDSFEQTTIPIVVNRQAGTSFRISLEDLTIPESVEVVLEDTETQTFTNLRTEDFTLNPQNDLSGMGRFYLRLGNTSLGGSDLEESYISIYNPMDKDYITIEGLANTQKANVRLYNIIGQEILSKTLQTGLSTQNISTAGLTTGIYVIKLEVDSTLISKKIVIN